MPNLELVRKDDVSSFRKIAIGTWRTAYDPSVYGTSSCAWTRRCATSPTFREKTGKKLTVSHMMAKAAAMVLKECPDANAILRWNRVYLRKRIGVFFQVVMTDEGADKVDLSGATLYDVEGKSLVEIFDEFNAKVESVRARKDPALEKTRSTFLGIPYFALGTVFAADIVSFVHVESRFAALWNPAGSVRQHHDHQYRLARIGYRVCAAGALFARADPDRDRRGQGRSRRGGRARSCRAR